MTARFLGRTKRTNLLRRQVKNYLLLTVSRPMLCSELRAHAGGAEYLKAGNEMDQERKDKDRQDYERLFSVSLLEK